MTSFHSAQGRDRGYARETDVVGEFGRVAFHSKRGMSPIDLVAELSIFTWPSFVAATGG